MALAWLGALLVATPAEAAWHGGAANATLTELDAVPNLYAVCAAKRMISGYVGPLYQVTRDSDGVTSDIYPTVSGWPDTAALLSFAGGSLLLRTICYDQTGNARNLAAAANTAPYVNIDGGRPVFGTDGAATVDVGNTALNAFTNNVSGASIIMVRQAEAPNSTLQTTARVLGGTGAVRMILRQSTGNKAVIGGGVLDASTTIFSTGLTLDTSWHVEVGTWNFATASMVHTIDASSETASFGTGSNTSATNSTATSAGANTNSTGYWAGKYSVIAFVSGVVAPATVTTMVSRLAAEAIPSTPSNQFPVWPASVSPVGGAYTLAPGVAMTAIQQPDGTTPDLADPASMRYVHHTRVGVEPSNGRIFVCHSANPVNEDDGGMFTECLSSVDGGTTWTAPVITVPPQSPFSPTGGVGTNALYVYPRNMQVYNGHLYFVTDVEGGSTGAGLALLAQQCNPDGTFGTPVVISPGGMYPPYDGTFPVYVYDAALSAALYPYNILHGQWQGTLAQFVSLPLSPWTGESRANGSRFAEVGTATLPDGTILMLWRKTTGALTHSIWLQISRDSGVSFTPMTRTNLPNQPSSVTAIMLSNGHLAVIANPLDHAGSARDPLFIATFNATTGANLAVYAVAQNMIDVPTYPGNAKNGGPTYSDAVESSLPNGINTLYVSFSSHGKEWVYLATIPVSGL